LVAELASIKGQDFGIVSYPKQPSFGIALQGGFGGMKQKATMETGSIDSQLKQLQYLLTYRKSGFSILAILPYILDIK
jgi:hypothetical protein